MQQVSAVARKGLGLLGAKTAEILLISFSLARKIRGRGTLSSDLDWFSGTLVVAVAPVPNAWASMEWQQSHRLECGCWWSGH